MWVRVPLRAFPNMRSNIRTFLGNKNSYLLFLSSFLALYLELIIIRYLSSEIRVFAYLKNLPLIASFFGIGLGMLLGHVPKILKKILPLLLLILFSLISFAPELKLTHIPFPRGNLLIMGAFNNSDLIHIIFFVSVVLSLLGIITGIFIALGGYIGEYFSKFPALQAYGINLFGSLAGILAFSALSYALTPPGVWFFLAAAALLPLYKKMKWQILALGATTAILFLPRPDSYWSPYYHLSLSQYPLVESSARPSAYEISVNYDYFQKLVDLSPEFIKQHPNAEPNRSAYETYELPYKIVPNPKRVLIIGAGAGNDAAAALRHGAEFIDAVEIDPTIYALGKKYHPEKPYDSPRVRMHVNDARAFLKTAKGTYDLIIFAYLDAHTLLASHASIRLDDYVYTKESFMEAKKLLAPSGTLIVSFASGNSFVTPRIYATLSQAFGAPPKAYATDYDSAGRVFIEGAGKEQGNIKNFREITGELKQQSRLVAITTDNWPFLYLRKKSVSAPILVLLTLYIIGAAYIIKKTVRTKNIFTRETLHFLFLGAGFLLLETRAITQLSLVFGSTWMVNSIVIASFLSMAIFANYFAVYKSLPLRLCYPLLLITLVISFGFPSSALDSLPAAQKILAAGLLVGIPVFFTGLIFSQSFKKAFNPSQALGINLFGAIIGGALENAIMIGGTSILGILALGIYGISLLVWRKIEDSLS